MDRDDRNIEVTQTIADVFTKVFSEFATLGTGTVRTAIAIDHDNGKIAHGAGGTQEEAEQDALDRLESGDSEDYYEGKF